MQYVLSPKNAKHEMNVFISQYLWRVVASILEQRYVFFYSSLPAKLDYILAQKKKIKKKILRL
jgi:hypothetical protein